MKLKKLRIVDREKFNRIKIIIIVITLFVSFLANVQIENAEDDIYDEVKEVEKIEQELKPKYKIYNIPLGEELQEFTYNLCQKNNIPETLIYAIMKAESGFDKKGFNTNRNGTNDKGLMQINSGYRDWYAELAGIDKEEFNRNNPEHSIKAGIGGVVFLREYWMSQGITNEDLLFNIVLLSYNRGISGAKKYIKKYGYNHAYVDKIFKYKSDLEQYGEIRE